MKRPSRDDLHPPVVRQLQDDVIVDEMEGAVKRVDGKLCRPVELNFVERKGAFARHRFPRGAVVLVADERRDDAVLVHLTDVCAVGDEDLAVDADCDA